ncbi:hypothetical protein [Chitinimonas sp. BJB300]|uniref:hypothetical protein n=1 Tax=Chitinimonas sp. BJB300 TaxID=1559339 RepID=UPI000C0FF33F|nr:hypothetical protein [Chitinimonas sp. BJB300]PHV13063.1 hypothetical protein CSQ89_02510 [Chitinimonas sp. BJB300]TSJ87727.1 hypothetical protein FG002_012345 [Chitinimonas sp. BJB300]
MNVKKITPFMLSSALAFSSIYAKAETEGTIDGSKGGGKAQSTEIKAEDNPYVLEDFKLNTSANVILKWKVDATAAALSAGHIKGMHTFAGTTAGGSVKQCEGPGLTVINDAAVKIPDLALGCTP